MPQFATTNFIVTNQSAFIDECNSVTGYDFSVYAGGSCYVGMSLKYSYSTYYEVKSGQLLI